MPFRLEAPGADTCCSDEDQFTVLDYLGRVVTVETFQTRFPGMAPEAEIANTTVQRTTESADGETGSYEAGSLRMYVGAATGDGGSEVYSLLSRDGIVFELELDVATRTRLFGSGALTVHARLEDGEVQAESYVDDDGTTWMYYFSSGDGSAFDVDAGIRLRTSTNGLHFGEEAAIPELTDQELGGTRDSAQDVLTGLSVARIGAGSYRGYFASEPSDGAEGWVDPWRVGPADFEFQSPLGAVVADPLDELGVHPPAGTIYAATSDDLMSWTLEAPGGNVGPHGEIIGSGANGSMTQNGMSVRDPSGRQPFALSRGCTRHPACVTLLYCVRTATNSNIYYSTALDGVTFTKLHKLALSDDAGNQVSAAGPTVVQFGDHRGAYLLYTDGQDADGHRVQAHRIRLLHPDGSEDSRADDTISESDWTDSLLHIPPGRRRRPLATP